TADDDQMGLVEELRSLREETEKLLGKQLESTDDPIAMLTTELEAVGLRLKALETAIKTRQDRLTAIETDFKKVRAIREFLELEQKKRIIDHIKESAEWQALEGEKERMAQYVADVEAIKVAITAASNAEGSQKLSAAEKAIDEFFRLLTKQTAGKGI